jgi:hypothetical protein
MGYVSLLISGIHGSGGDLHCYFRTGDIIATGGAVMPRQAGKLVVLSESIEESHGIVLYVDGSVYNASHDGFE